MLWIYSLIAGVVAGLLAASLPLINRKDKDKKDKVKRAGLAFAVAGVISFIIIALTIFIFLPTFAHWSDSGYTLIFYLVLIIGACVGGFAAYNEYSEYSYRRSSNTALWVLIVLTFTLGIGRLFPVGFFQMGIGPNPCSLDSSHAAIQKLLIFDEVNSLDEIQASSVEKVSDSRSLQLAKNAQPQSLQLGEYLIVKPGYEQVVNGVPMNVHPMAAKDLSAYNRYGTITPGYLLVDTSRTDGFAQWIGREKGDEFYYITGGNPFRAYDIQRHVYTKYSLPKGVQVWDLKGPEVDDDLNFWYVGTVMKPSEAGGARYYMPAGIITVDPHSGEIAEYTLKEADEKLPWLDRKLPLKAAKILVGDYAKYQANAAICNIITQSGQWEIDEDPIIATRNGHQVMQFFATTLNDEDPLVQEIIYVQPNSMTAQRFPGAGMLVTYKTRTLVEKRANPNLKPELYSVHAKEPTHMWFSGSQFMVYVLERGTTFMGFGAIRSDLALKENDQYVLLSDTIGELSRLANDQLARIKPGSLDNERAEASFEIQVNGIVDFISTPYMDNNNIKVLFTVAVSETQDVYLFRANSRTLAEELVAVGHEVTVTGQATSEYRDVTVAVSTIRNESYIIEP